jgi:hypothetical protein
LPECEGWRGRAAMETLTPTEYDAIPGLLRLHRALFRRSQPSDRQVMQLLFARIRQMGH